MDHVPKIHRIDFANLIPSFSSVFCWACFKDSQPFWKRGPKFLWGPKFESLTVMIYRSNGKGLHVVSVTRGTCKTLTSWNASFFTASSFSAFSWRIVFSCSLIFSKSCSFSLSKILFWSRTTRSTLHCTTLRSWVKVRNRLWFLRLSSSWNYPTAEY